MLDFGWVEGFDNIKSTTCKYQFHVNSFQDLLIIELSLVQREVSYKISGGTFEWTRPPDLFWPITRPSLFKCPSRNFAWLFSFIFDWNFQNLVDLILGDFFSLHGKRWLIDNPLHSGLHFFDFIINSLRLYVYSS